MFCIFAFVLFMILGIFSASYRSLAKKAWGCVWIRLTFRACDISLQDEIRARFVGKYIVTKPRLANFLTKWMDTIAFVFVALSIWSLLVVVNSGINYYVYDTCSPSDPESCSLSAGACGVGTYKPTFFESLTTGNIISWTKDEVVTYFDKLGRIPDRMKKWEASEFVSDTATYYNEFDSSKKTALEIIDPGCIYCSQMFKSTKESGFADKYNLTYILYPIPNPEVAGEYKFKNSLLVSRYAEALKQYKLDNNNKASDWLLLEKIYTGKSDGGEDNQKLFNDVYSSSEAEIEIHKWLTQFGYSDSKIKEIKTSAESKEIMDSISSQKMIVDNEVRTVKIPTIIFGDRRFDRVVDEETLLK